MQQPRVKPQRQLFEENPAVPVAQLPGSVQEKLRHALVQWMQALAKTLRVEDSDEQDYL